MKTLVLLRHAKSSWDDASLRDFDRPLNARGQQAAPRMGSWLRGAGLVPDLVLCSAAQRTLDTWALVAPLLERSMPVRVEQDLYLADPETMLRLVQSAGDDVETLLVVAHNPGTEELARALTGAGAAKKALKRMRRKFPTGAVAVLDFDVATWPEVAPGTGRLRAFVRPKDAT